MINIHSLSSCTVTVLAFAYAPVLIIAQETRLPYSSSVNFGEIQKNQGGATRYADKVKFGS
ncbi:MAG: hypothetical protein D3925_01700 [Candidatus Electrothrix sp. AR5]|nr:hypothetical protein [Candidatus Electrothrix sp. AR5]